MRPRAELKAMAKEQIRGKIGILFLISFIIGLISSVASALLSLVPGGGAVCSIIITPAFTISVLRVYLNIARGNEPYVGDAFSGFDDFWTAFKTNFLVGLFTFLWSLLLIIPGIIKSISYSQAMTIVAENPGMSAREAIGYSKSMMEGHKMEYFVLQLSFFGWAFLGVFTLGILYIWLIPYMNATNINFYNNLKYIAQNNYYNANYYNANYYNANNGYDPNSYVDPNAGNNGYDNNYYNNNYNNYDNNNQQ